MEGSSVTQNQDTDVFFDVLSVNASTFFAKGETLLEELTQFILKLVTSGIVICVSLHEALKELHTLRERLDLIDG